MRAILRDVWWSYRMHDGRLLAGALAFYVIMAATPFGVIALYVGGLVLGRADARQTLLERVRDAAGEEAAAYADASLTEAIQPREGALATVISVVFIFYVTTRLFHMLRAALNHLWGVRPTVPVGLRGRGLLVLRRRLVSFGMVFVAAALFALFGAVRAGTVVAARWMHLPWLLRVGEVTGSVAVLTLMIAFVYRWLPDARVAWRDAFVGATVTSLLAAVGSQGIGTYLAHAGVTSSYGAAGSVVVVILFVYYCAQIFFLGAEITGSYARHHGAGISPLRYATRVVVDHQSITGDDA